MVEINTEMEQAPDISTSENSLDWHGTYQGILPCADCEGIQTEVTLHDNNTHNNNT
ncbi:copper resistance protein NlpE [Planktosalinus lacus]|uniref:Uncharacterized protein n=1 Tax=Planktosalinus lacus TaxID=1526573 RepID=A0A8J2YAP4_9FLAO|nr:copper resistance protein NlpE [Planktosalinus lacus]GGD94473.1 hypothetical protein GCM10011312_17740 [Planktosalinus lacus]